MIKWVIRLFILLILLVILVVTLTDTIVKEVIVLQLNRRVGIESSIERVDVGFLSPRIRIENYVLYNSAQYGGVRFLEIPEIMIEYDFERAINGEARIRLLRIDCSAINIVRDKLDRNNIEELFRIAFDRTVKKNGGTRLQVFIDVMNLSIGKIRLMSLENPSNVREIPLNIRNYIVKNVSSEEMNSTFFYNLVLKILLDSGKIEIRDGKIVLKNN